MVTAIMQPYFFPYIGYFQLMNAVDKFVVYDNIQFTKKGWIHRNRLLVNNRDEYFTLPLKKDSDYLNIDKRYLADNFTEERDKMLRKFQGSYRKAPYFMEVFPLLEGILNYTSTNLFDYLLNSLQVIKDYLEISTVFVISSDVNIDHDLKSEKKVLAICKSLHSEKYINPIGGLELYSSENFRKNDIELVFLKSRPFSYPQFGNEFVPWLSILDVLMFNSKADIKFLLNNQFDLVTQ